MEPLTQCPLCDKEPVQQPPHAPEISGRDYMVSRDIYHVVHCDNCGFLFTNPRPNKHKISDLYASPDYISHTDAKKGVKNRLYQSVKRIMTRKKLAMISGALKCRNGADGSQKRTLLDFGCGTGEFVLAAVRDGYHAMGYEPSPGAADLARNKGAQIITDLSELSGAGDSTFDVISMWHVLEHLHDLNETLQIIRRLLSENGLLVVAVPMFNSVDARAYGKYWAALDLPRHLYHFTPGSLEKLADKHGFMVTRRHPLPYDSFYVSLLSEGNKAQERAIEKGLTRAGTPITGTLKAVFVAAWSNLSALTTQRPWSSETFILRRCEGTPNQND